MTHHYARLLGVLAALGAAGLAAQAGSASDPTLVALRERLAAQNPSTRIDSVTASPIAGLYEVVMGKNVAYMDASGRYALFGNVWDMQAHRDLTADRQALLDRIDPSSLPIALAVRHVKGKGTRTLYVFADPQCGYCRQLEQTLAAMDDLTVYTFVMPLLGPESARLSKAIACAADPAAAWSSWMLNGQQPPAGESASCDSTRPSDIEKLARSLGITSTPTLVAADGRKKAGALPAPQITAWLAAPATGALASATGAPSVMTTKTAPH